MAGRGILPKPGSAAGRGRARGGRSELQPQRSPGVTRRLSGEPMAGKCRNFDDVGVFCSKQSVCMDSAWPV